MILTGVKGNLLQLDSKGVRPPLERLKWEGVEGVVDCRRIVKGASGCTSCAVLWPDSWVLRKDGDLRVLTPWF